MLTYSNLGVAKFGVELVSGFATMPFHDDIIRSIFMELRRSTFGRLLSIGDYRERFIRYVNSLRRVRCFVLSFGNDNCDWIADEHRFTNSERPRCVDVIRDSAR